MIEHPAAYQAWSTRIGTPSLASLVAQREQSRLDRDWPTVSIITPVFNPPLDVLKEMIDSVLAQTYPYWEFCLGDFGDHPAIAAHIRERAAADPRIKPLFGLPNRGISRNSNRCAEIATGSLIGLLDHDDVLAPDALYESVIALRDGGHTLVYSDEDRLDARGNRTHPFFKPAWSPSILFSANYITHFAVFRHEDLLRIGGWRAETDGAQDWDLFFRLAAIPGASVGHVPKMLYRWRALETSVAGSGFDAKPYAMRAQIRACQSELDRLESNGVAQLSASWHLEIGFPPVNESTAIVVWGDDPNAQARIMRRLRALGRGSQILDLAAYERSMDRFDAAIFWNSGVEPVDARSLDDLAGWATLGGFGVAGANVIDSNSGMLMGIGFARAGAGIVDRIFASVDPGFYGIEGGVGWYRNVVAVAPEAFAMRTELVREHAREFMRSPSRMSALTTHSNCHNQGAFSTFVATARAQMATPPRSQFLAAPSGWPDPDPFVNPTLRQPGMLEWLSTGSLKGLHDDRTRRHRGRPATKPSQHSVGVHRLDAPAHAVDYNRRRNAAPLPSISSAVFVMPSFTSVYAGVANILRLAAHFAESDITTSFIVDGDANVAQRQAQNSFPALGALSFTSLQHASIRSFDADLAIATHWPTAYDVLRMSRVRRTAYFIQDDESMFYPAGSQSALAAQTYKLGLVPFTNSDALLGVGGIPAEQFVVLPTPVSLKRFAPSEVVRRRSVKRILFYGRPDNPRNGFELGIAALTLLKGALGDSVEILCAGDAWKEHTYGVEGLVTNLGKLPFTDLPALYRSCDAGLFLMFSRHPGVIPTEWMASGVPFVINELQASYPGSMYVHDENCLAVPPTPSCLADALAMLIQDPALHARLRRRGIDTVANEPDDWTVSADLVMRHVLRGLPETAVER